MLRWGLIGASTIAGEWMLGAMRAVGDEVVGVISADTVRAKAFAQRHNLANSGTRLEDMRNWGINAVYISSTNDKHQAQAEFAAAQGWHVLCEKPLATSLAAAQSMVQACQRAGVVMGTNHHLRHNSAHLQMREHIQQGMLGNLIAARVQHAVYLPKHLQGWRLNDKAAGGGVVLDIAVHNADSLAFLLGEYPNEVQAMTSNTGMAQGMEDHALSLWRFPSGLLATTHQGFNTPYASVRLEVHGTQGSLESLETLHQTPDGSLVLKNANGTKQLPLDGVNLYERGLQHFHRAVRGESNTLASGQAGVHSLAVALAVLESAQTQKTVCVQNTGY